MSEIHCLLYAESASAVADLSGRLEATDCVASVAESHQLGEIARRVGEGPCDALVVMLGDEAEATFRAVETLSLPRPAIVFLGPAERSEWILRAMRLGAREYLPIDADAATLGALMERVSKALERSPLREEPGPIIGVVGAKGGVGTTVVACQLAASLQHFGHGTALVDLNLRCGDVAMHYDLSRGYSLAELARTRKRVDASFLESLITQHASGVSVIPAPERPEDGELVMAEHVAKALRLLRSHFDCVVVDLPTPWDDPGLRALDLLDALLLVTNPDLASLAQTRKQLELLDRIGVPNERVHVVLNRVGSRESIRRKEAVNYLGRPVTYALPNDYLAVSNCINTGGTLERAATHSALASAFRTLAPHLAESLQIDRDPAARRIRPRGRLASAFDRFDARLRGLLKRSRPSSAEGETEPANNPRIAGPGDPVVEGPAVAIEGAGAKPLEDRSGANGSMRSH